MLNRKFIIIITAIFLAGITLAPIAHASTAGEDNLPCPTTCQDIQVFPSQLSESINDRGTFYFWYWYIIIITPPENTNTSNKTGDGEIYNGGSSTWSTVHDATSGTTDAVSDTAYAYTEHNGTDFWMARVALPFDTSSLPDNATITSAKLYVYVDTKSDGDNDGTDTIRVVQNTTASSTALADGDFDQIGTVSNPTAGANDTDITGISTGGYLNIPLNVTGQGWISKTGYTKLGLREGHDATNSAATSGTGITGARIKTADATGSTLGASSYQVATTTGSYSDTYTGSSSNDWSMIAAEFRPATTGGTTTTNTWSHKNQLTQTVVGSTTVVYDYDHTGTRARLYNGTANTHYPSKYYNATGATETKHIFTPGGDLVATKKGADVYYAHTDHLTGSSVMSTSSGALEELMDYYPYGSIRLDEKSGSFGEQRKWIGQEYDADTGLNYLNARYYDSATGRFISQDPEASFNPEKFLSDPQQLNYYSYARNNPITLSDPSGRCVGPLVIACAYLVMNAEALAFGAIATAIGYFAGKDAVSTYQNPSATNSDKVISLLNVGVAVLSLGAGKSMPTSQKLASEEVTAMKSARVAQNATSSKAGTNPKTYQVYEKVNSETGDVYVGRTSGTGSPEKNVQRRDSSHHMNEKGYGLAQLKYSTGQYDANRGQEQLKIDQYKTQGNSGNTINGVSPSNPNWTRYIGAALKMFGFGRSK